MRATSTEKTSGNESNVAKFTNKLNQSLILNVGDQVSIERSFVNGLGAGNQDTIQFSGKKIKPKRQKTQKYTIVNGNNFQDKTFISPLRMGYYLGYQVSEEETEPLEIKDNEASLIIGYYITSNNHPSYLQLPRRFASQYYNQSDSKGDWVEADTDESGLPLEGNSVDRYSYCYADWHFQEIAGKFYIKQRVDNSRFTLYLREKVFYAWETSNNSVSPPTTSPIVGRAIQSETPYLPSWSKYHRYRERKIIKVDTGFSTPQSVADQIQQQLNQSEEAEIFEIADTSTSSFYGTAKHTLTTTMKAETYKPFNVAHISGFTENGWDDFSRFDSIPTTNRIMEYDAQFYSVGVKRPEIWDAGRDFVGGEFLKGFSYIAKTIDINDRDNILIYTEFEWVDEYLTYLKNLFEAQKLYPELWDDLDKLQDYYGFTPAQMKLLNPENSAFLHVSRYGNSTSDPTKIPHPIEYWGQDGLGRTAKPYSSGGQTATAPLFFKYDPNQKDYYVQKSTFTPSIESRWDENKFVYGFAQPWYRGGKYYIAISMKGVPPVPYYFFNGTTPAEGGNPAIPKSKIWGSEDLTLTQFSGRWIGYDWSFTAYGTACILPYSPQHEKSFEGQGVTQGSAHWLEAVRTFDLQSIIPTIIYSTQSYMGANNPLVSYNTETNRFEISQLHTAENLGNSWDAGDMGSGKLVAPPINPDAGDVVYKINPRIGYDGFAPTFKPYTVDATVQFADPDGANSIPGMVDWGEPPATEAQLQEGANLNSRDVSLSNINIEPYKIFDAWGGIYFDDMGYNIEEWEQNSLWGRMGFSWEQFNSQPNENNVLDLRVSDQNRYSLYRPTTNSIVDTTDTKAFYVNLYGAPLYSTAIGTAKIIQNRSWSVPNTGLPYKQATFEFDGYYEYYPALTQKTSSLVLSARNLPKLQLNPFYTIRSNIIGYTDYLGSAEGGMRLNVVGIIDRYGAQGDFFYGSPSDITFTITKQTIISDIETEICNPDGTLADVNSDCGVIYKVQKNMPAPQNIIEQIIEQTQKKK
jgi:hypothetical protein